MEKTDEAQVWLGKKKKKKKKVPDCTDTVHWSHSPGLQQQQLMDSTTLQSMIQVLFYNSESQRKKELQRFFFTGSRVNGSNVRAP